jgi:hypothetical protein
VEAVAVVEAAEVARHRLMIVIAIGRLIRSRERVRAPAAAAAAVVVVVVVVVRSVALAARSAAARRRWHYMAAV